MEKFKLYGSLFLAMLTCFNIGLYCASTFNYHDVINAHRWIMTILFGMVFLVSFLINIKKK